MILFFWPNSGFEKLGCERASKKRQFPRGFGQTELVQKRELFVPLANLLVRRPGFAFRVILYGFTKMPSEG